MIGGAAQADVGILVISARKGEFETGFERGGQTREHAMLAKTLGACAHAVAVCADRGTHRRAHADRGHQQDGRAHREVGQGAVRRHRGEAHALPQAVRVRPAGYTTRAMPAALQRGDAGAACCSYKPGKDMWFLPISGYTGANLRDLVDPSVCPWFKGPTLLQILDDLPSVKRDDKAPVRIPVVTKYKDMGVTVILGEAARSTRRRRNRRSLLTWAGLAQASWRAARCASARRWFSCPPTRHALACAG